MHKDIKEKFSEMIAFILVITYVLRVISGVVAEWQASERMCSNLFVALATMGCGTCVDGGMVGVFSGPVAQLVRAGDS